mmetsp:Transcript_151345/g.263821  ORF Transcript_151345/g.263821 Transcript_151345/m.263821 type:complete len:496 (-) Transcript_151345:157-1644(-)
MAAGSEAGDGAHPAGGRPAPTTPPGVLATQAGVGHRTVNFVGNALESGPGTILGGKTTLIDPVAQRLWEILETTLMGDLQTLEVEVRVGRIVSTSEASPSGGRRGADPPERLGLPLTTEAILSRETRVNFYKFVPGLSEEIFVPLLQRIEALSRKQDGQFECIVNTENSVDITYQRRDGSSPDSFRVSHFFEDGDQGNVTRAFKKQKLGSFDVYAGHRRPEHGPAFDFRVAVSAEEPLPDFVAEEHVAKLKREKHRKRYVYPAWVLDATDVTTTELDVPQDTSKNGRQQKHISRSSLEIELELRKEALIPNLKAKAEGKNHKLWELLTDFLFAARDLTGLAAELAPYALPPPMLPVLSNVVTGNGGGAAADNEVDKKNQGKANAALDDEDREVYRKRYGNVPEPVIGHYLYRLAAPRVPSTRLTSESLGSLKRTFSAAGNSTGPDRQVEGRKNDAGATSEDVSKEDQGRLRAKNLEAWKASLKLPGPAPRTAPNE